MAQACSAPRAGPQPTEPVGRPRAEDSVSYQPGTPLEPPQRGVGPSTEVAVEPSRSPAAPTEQELQDSDVVAAHAAADDASAEEGLAPRAERRSRPRPREAVDGEPMAPLEASASLTTPVFFDKQQNGDTIYCYRRQ